MAKTSETNIGIILLAAGSSSRLGRPKQLLSYDGQTLLQHTIQVASDSNAHPVVVVLGAQAEMIRNDIKEIDVNLVDNPDWQEGMASSIRSGINAFTEIAPDAEGMILMVCDQPHVNPSLLNEIITAHKRTGKPIVACSYEKTFGPPVFFHRSLFAELLQLKGDIGARSVVRQHTDEVEVIPFPEGVFDIDTEADFKNLSGRSRE